MALFSKENFQFSFHNAAALSILKRKFLFVATGLKEAQVMQKKKYNGAANQQILPFRKIVGCVTVELFF